MELDLGDGALFEQLLDDGEKEREERDEEAEEEEEEEEEEEDGGDQEEVRALRRKLQEREEAAARLQAQNEELKRKLRFFTRPAGLNVADSKVDGPLFHILFGNNSISKRCRWEAEELVYGLVQKHQREWSNEQDGCNQYLYPQNSSFVMDEGRKSGETATGKPVKDAFRVVGSVLYFTTFCLDQLGQPLLNDNPQLTEGWEVPKYPQVFSQVMAMEGQEVQIKEKRPKPCCFNCGEEGHQLRDCPKPKDLARISEKRKEFSNAASLAGIVGGQRYHAEEVEERFSKYKPGVVSKELLDALGVASNTLPPFIYRMRELGYPPGWLKEAEMENSGLTLYDGTEPGEGEKDSSSHGQSVSYDVSKLVDFPGFNAAVPSDIRDDYKCFGSIPMQPHHWKDLFAAQLAKAYPAQGSAGLKRCHEADSTPQHGKKPRSHSDISRNSDMDIETESDQGTPRRSQPDGSFQFQPPLPPGSPLISTPPPLPKGTPPPTPPSHASPLPPGRAGTTTAAGEESEDGLSLEELEEQQRLLWAELQNADSTNSDSETPPPGSDRASPANRGEAATGVSEEDEGSSHFRETLSTPASPDAGGNGAEGEERTEAGEDLIILDEVSQETSAGTEEEEEVVDVTPENDGDATTNLTDEVDDSVAVIDAGKNGTVEAPEPTSTTAPDDDQELAPPKVTHVPHRSKFAEGIIPFEDTPEFTEVAEATGVYLRIRDLLKGSPRSAARNKK